jgi:hypothetical protein
MLSRFLVCRERFRIHYVLGLQPAKGFNHRVEYGNMWHVCEETYARIGHGKDYSADWELFVSADLKEYCTTLCRRYPLNQDEIMKWWRVCQEQYPVYVAYWNKHPDVRQRTPLLQEYVFDVPYLLPSGRTVRLRGKFDSVDFIGSLKTGGVYLQENKTKGDVDEFQLQRQLTFDLQSMLYLTALHECQQSPVDNTPKTRMSTVKNSRATPSGRIDPDGSSRSGSNHSGVRTPMPIKGIRYNVIRRPLSGGKGTIKQKAPTKNNPQGETSEQYYNRLAEYFRLEPETYFMRWRVEVTASEVTRFRRECLDPVLEQLCDWWEVMKELKRQGADTFASTHHPLARAIHWRHPFGVYNVLDEGGSSDLDEYLNTGSTVGLQRVDKLYPELG